MQTFMPSRIFTRSIAVLDDRRLNKQIIEAYQIWSGRVPNANHPACLMWDGYSDALLLYIKLLLTEYAVRKNKWHSIYDNIKGPINSILLSEGYNIVLPKWTNNELFHISHRVNLLRKDYKYYEFSFSALSIPMPSYPISEYPTGYYWPVMPVGKKAREDRAAWEKWGKEHNMPIL